MPVKQKPVKPSKRAQNFKKEDTRLYKRLAKFPETNPNPVLETDLSGRVIYKNPATDKFIKKMGLKNERELFSKALPEIAGLGKQSPVYREIKAGGHFFGINLCPSVKEGIVRIYLFDITRRKEMEEELAKSEDLLHSFFESPGVMRGVVEIVRGADILHVMDNLESARFFRTTSKAMRGRLESEMGVDQENTRLWIKNCKLSRRTGKPVQFEFKSGDAAKTIWLSMTVTYNGKSAGGIGRYSYMGMDITGGKKTEEDLKQALLMLQDAKTGLEARVEERAADLVLARKAVEYERQKLYLVLNTIPAYVVLLDADHRVPFANRYFEDRFGRSNGRRCYEYLFGLKGPCRNCESYKVFKKDHAHRWEWKGPDGRDYEIYDYPFRDTDGSDLVLEMGIDVTDKKAAQEELQKHRDSLEALVAERTADLRESEEKFRAIASNTPDHILIQDNDLRYTAVINPQLGLTERDMLGKTDFDFLSREDAGRLTAIKKKVIESGETAAVSLPLFNSKGEAEFFEGSYVPRRGPEGKVEGLIGYFRNITERRRAADALRESEERFRAAFDQGAVGMALTATDNRLLSVNPAFCRLTGYTADELARMRFSDITHPDDLPGNIEGMKKVQSGEIKEFRMEKRCLRKDGAVVWVDMNTAVARDANGSPLYFVTYVQDITQRKSNEAELVKANRTLKAIGASGQVIMRKTDEESILREVCKIVTDVCGYAMVWIGYAMNDEKKSVVPVAYAGFEEGYLESLDITWADTERGRGPTGTAIRTANMAACRNMLTDPAFEPWREQALKRGYASSIVFPLVDSGRAFGAINIYSRDPDPFTPGEIGLLGELSADLSQGIVSARLRAANARSEEALARHVSELEAVLAAQNDTVIIYNTEMNVMLANPAFGKSYGFDPVGLNVRDIIAGVRCRSMDGRPLVPEDQPTPRAIRGETVKNECFLVARADGSDAFVETSSGPMKVGDAIIGSATVWHDITGRVMAEYNLRETKEYLESLITYANAPIIVWDPQFRITRFNGAFERLTGYGSDRVLGRELGMLFPEVTKSASMELIRETSEGEFWDAVEIPILRSDGGVRTVLWNSANIHDPSGGILATIAQGQDITDRKRAEEVLKNANELLEQRVRDRTRELEESNRSLEKAMEENRLKDRMLMRSERLSSLGQLSSAIAHEIRQPLNAIKILTDGTLYWKDRKEDLSPDDMIVNFQRISQSVDRIEKIIKNMSLLLVSPDRIEIEDLNVNQVIFDIVSLVDQKLKDHSIGLELDLDYNVAPLSISRSQLQSVIVNLINNAVNALVSAGKPSKSLKIETRETGESVRLRVIDNGPGISGSDKEKIFNPFFTTYHNPDGMGLGLYIVNTILKNFNSTVDVSDNPPEGAVFTITLTRSGHDHANTDSR